MKRFSWKAFAIVTPVHILLTLFFVALSIQSQQDSLWLDISAWIWAPVPMLLSHYVPGLVLYHLYLLLLWSVCIGLFVGFIVPGMRRQRQRTV